MTSMMTGLLAGAPALGSQKKPSTPAEVAKVAKDFESMFVGQLLRSMPQESLTGHEAGPYGDFLVDQYAKLVTDHGGIGVAKTISQELMKIYKVQNS